MPRKGENIYKRKDGRWEGRYIRSYDSEHKAKYAYVYGKTYSEVKRKLTEQRGNVQKVQPTKNKSSTYGELLDCWLHSMQLKKETERWKRILAWTCVYLVTAERSDQAAEVLYKPIVRYLRSLDEDRLLDVRQAVIQDVPSSRCDYLFDEVRRKEGFVEKLGGFFHKK